MAEPGSTLDLDEPDDPELALEGPDAGVIEPLSGKRRRVATWVGRRGDDFVRRLLRGLFLRRGVPYMSRTELERALAVLRVYTDPALLETVDRLKTVGGAIERGLTRLGFAPVFAFRVRAIVSIAAEQQLAIGGGMTCDRAFLRSIERYGSWKADLATNLTRFSMEFTGHLRTDETAAMPCEARRGGPR